LDCPPGSAEPWLPLVDANGDRKRFDEAYPQGTPRDVVSFLLLDRNNPNSVVSCIANARENARQIRDVITTEMWEQLNDLYWNVQDGEALWQEPDQEQLRSIRRGCQLFYGITDVTLSRDQAWLFSQLGRLIERADKTSRILDVKYFLLLPTPTEVGGVLDELQWISLLRTAGAYQMYRQSVQQAITPVSVARFLLLDPIFPRSVRFCLQEINATLERIHAGPHAGPPDDLECLRGHYALTLAEWHRRFNLQRCRFVRRSGEKFCRMWEFYLLICQTAFEVGGLAVHHWQLQRPAAQIPVTRDYLYS
ncbi:MAG: hypothetical protein CBC52_000810, partial [Gammaproteobacteria bacterium TMED92]